MPLSLLCRQSPLTSLLHYGAPPRGPPSGPQGGPHVQTGVETARGKAQPPGELRQTIPLLLTYVCVNPKR